MRILVFVMNAPPIIPELLPLFRALSSLNAEITVVDYWCVDLFPLEAILRFSRAGTKSHGSTGESASSFQYLTLSDGGPGTIPRLSHRQYVALCGDDIDFVTCSSHNYAVEGYPVTREWLFADSIYYQRLYGFAYRVEGIIRSVSPDYVLVKQGSEPISKLVCAKAMTLRIPLLLLESSFVPDRILLDPVGMHFFPGENRIDRDWNSVSDRPLTSREEGLLNEYLQKWKSSGVSKYVQQHSDEESLRLESWLAARPAHTPVLFFPGQVPHDANVLASLGSFASYEELLQAVAQALPRNWAGLYKVHPKSPLRTPVPGPWTENLYVVQDVCIYNLFERTSAILALSSNVGFEAILRDKPVICIGRPYYGGKGFTIDIEEVAHLPKALAHASTFQIDRQRRDRFAYYILFDYLIDPQDPQALGKRLEEAAHLAPAPQADARKPYCRHYPHNARAFVRLVHAYNARAAQNYSHREIMNHLRHELPADPDLGRWLATTDPRAEAESHPIGEGHLGNFGQDRLIRYSFARAFITENQEVLDACCGFGYGSCELASVPQTHITAFDCSKEAITFARTNWNRANISFIHGSTGSWDPPQSTYNTIVAFDALECMADAGLFLSRLWDALKPGGLIILSAPNLNYYPLTNNDAHVEHYFPDSICELASNLPNLDASYLLSQHAAGIHRGTDGRVLIVLLLKVGGLQTNQKLEADLGRLIPFDVVRNGSSRGWTYYSASELRVINDGLRQGSTVISSPQIRERLGIRDTDVVVHGPYCTLDAGEYDLMLDLCCLGPCGERTETAEVFVKLAADCGRHVLVELPIAELRHEGNRYVMPFRLDRQLKEFEVVLYHRGTGTVIVSGYAWARRN